MKKQLLALIALTCATLPLFAQKLEVSVQANTGWFHFSGKSATATSIVLQGNNSSNPTADRMNYTNNPYGSGNAVSYGGSLQGQYVTKSGFIGGLQAGYEFLQSKVNITTYQYSIFTGGFQLANIPFVAAAFPVKGHTNLQNKAINLSPYIGYRLQLNKVKLDILPGMDIGLILKTVDKGTVKDEEGNTYTVNREGTKAPTDVRLRLGAILSYGRVGINASYAHGVTNYLSGYASTSGNGSGNGSTFTAHSELLRLGLSYRLN